MDSTSRKKKLINVPKGTNGKLTKTGQTYKNSLLDTDFTNQRQTIKKVK